jgi:hypothetical protein
MWKTMEESRAFLNWEDGNGRLFNRDHSPIHRILAESDGLYPARRKRSMGIVVAWAARDFALVSE